MRWREKYGYGEGRKERGKEKGEREGKKDIGWDEKRGRENDREEWRHGEME